MNDYVSGEAEVLKEQIFVLVFVHRFAFKQATNLQGPLVFSVVTSLFWASHPQSSNFHMRDLARLVSVFLFEKGNNQERIVRCAY